MDHHHRGTMTTEGTMSTRASETCGVCHEAITDEAAAMGWPIPRLEDGQYVCPSCLGDEAYCGEGHVLPATVDSSSCPTCDQEDVGTPGAAGSRHARPDPGLPDSRGAGGSVMTQHTPGPWKVSEYHKAVTTTTVSQDGCVQVVCEIPYINGPTGDLYKANARLIAAAPEMLELLQRANALLARIRGE